MGSELMQAWVRALAARHARRDEAGLTTAELLANAALGVGALAALWGALRAVGLDIVDMIRDQLL